MWKHKNFINLQLCAGPQPFEIYVNGEQVEIQRLSDSMVPGEETWSYNASINTDKYTISGNTVVWSNGTILQYNGVDVLPTDTLVMNRQYTTRSATSSLTFKHFYDAGTIGTGAIKFRHYSQQEPSSGGVIKAGTYLFNEKLTEVTSGNNLDLDFLAKGNSLTADNVYGNTVNIEHVFVQGSGFLSLFNTSNGEASWNLKEWVYNDGEVEYVVTDNTKLRTITLVTDQAVIDEFYTWFTANTTKLS